MPDTGCVPQRLKQSRSLLHGTWKPLRSTGWPSSSSGGWKAPTLDSRCGLRQLRELRGAMGVSTLFCTSTRNFSSQLREGLGGRCSCRLAPHRPAMSTPRSLECCAWNMPGMGNEMEHRTTPMMSLTALLVQWAPHASQLRWHLATRAVRLERHSSMSSPDSPAIRWRANLNSQYSRSGRIMYSTSVTPLRCVRVALGEQ